MGDRQGLRSTRARALRDGGNGEHGADAPRDGRHERPAVADAADLRRREQRLRALLRHATDLVLVWNTRGEITYASPAGIRFACGDSPDVTIDDVRRTGSLVHPEDVALLTKVGWHVAERRGSSERCVARLRRADGVYRTLEVTLTNLFDDPAIGGLVANARDITEQLEFEEALRQNEQRWAALVRNSYDLIAVVDEAATLTYASSAAEDMLGHPPDSLIGTSALGLVHPDDLERAQAALDRVLAEPEVPVRVELRLGHADGSWRWNEVVASNSLDDPAVQGIVLNNRDVTDRRESEEWFRGLVAHGYDIIAVLDAEERVRYVSPSIEHMLGHRAEELVGETGLAFIHPDDRASVTKHFSRVLSGPGFHVPVELRARHTDGTWRWLDAVHTNQLDNPAVNGVVVNFRDITERKLAEQELAHQAVHDSLTDLPNRVLLGDRLEQALARAARDERAVGVLFLDLDRFKLVNDTRGHAVGDELLHAVGRRLRDATRVGDTVARFGGDEFVVVYEGIADTAELVSLGRRLCATLAEPFRVEGTDLYVTSSVGAALGRPGTSGDALLRDADAAMYHVKELGGDAVEVVDDAIRRRVHIRFETERALHIALAREELTLAYQPIAELDTGRVVQVEALLRWDHPERGTILPDQFVDLAEETGLILPIGAWVLEEACRQVAEWRAAGTGSDLGLSVNLSVVQLRDPDLAAVVGGVLERVGLDPAALTLEITESFLMEDKVACRKALCALKALGVHLALDDFGTRYASLGRINDMPLDGLKIDRSFVQRLGGEAGFGAIVAAIIAMADALDLGVIAEGVETALQQSQLLELGCRVGQGQRLAPPLCAGAVERVLRDGIELRV